ncbi:MAG TPA: glycosyltransferase [Casimicrobiaceae bacterium]
MRYREALDVLADAAERTGWTMPMVRHNLGLVLGKLMWQQANAEEEAMAQTWAAREQERLATRTQHWPRVSVVMTARNSARFIARSIESVASQTYKDIELIVVDDGSTDNTAAVAKAALSGLPLPTQLRVRERLGAALAANEGAAVAQGSYIAFLDADDLYTHDRIESLVAEIVRDVPAWGFSRIARFADDGELGDPEAYAAADNARRSVKRTWAGSTSFVLVGRDAAGANGNLFVARSLFRALDGFRDVVDYHGWDFCVRAGMDVEPVSVERTLYLRREPEGHGTAATEAANTKARPMSDAFFAQALAPPVDVRNVLSPQHPRNRQALLRSRLRTGHGEELPVDVLRALTVRWQATLAAAASRPRAVPGSKPTEKVALVVLGMHRSGTSALARVINLCGAFLPQRIAPAKLGVNPKGFWEAEAVNDLNQRVLRQLGADWSIADFDLPVAGDLVEDFIGDVGALMAAEYEDRALVVIKDPRICLLAPLWHRALAQAGYRAAYVVPVRNPLEVARSLEARGDMPVTAGIELWFAYMQRVEQFIASVGAQAIHVRYADLLDDWRSVVGRIATRLDVPLAVAPHAAEADRFVENGLRNQHASDADLNANLREFTGDAIRALYKDLLAQCESDAFAATRASLAVSG